MWNVTVLALLFAVCSFAGGREWESIQVVDDKPKNCTFLEDIWIAKPWLFEFKAKQIAKKVENLMKQKAASLGGDTVYIKDIDVDGREGAKGKGKAYRCAKP